MHSVTPKDTNQAKSNVGLVSSWKGFRYAMCNESMQGMKWKDQCELVAQAGYKGIEIAPFSLVEKGIEELTPRKRQSMVSAMKNSGIQCVGLHWLLSPPPPKLHFTSPKASIRKRTLNYLDRLIDFCADLGGTVMVFGSPKGRNTVKGISVREAKKFLAEGLARLAPHAQERGVKILLEPLGHNQTDVVNTMEEALEIIKTIGHPALQTMFDFHNTIDETLSFPEIIQTYWPFIHHVHVMEMDGKYLGTASGMRDYLPAFQALKDRGYEKWVSVEVFDFSPGPRGIARESMKSLKTIESKLK
jgi:sugar phosphate isomerase/epimerase